MLRGIKNLNLYKKFTLTIIIIGLVPMMVLSTFIANRMIRDYRDALRAQYEQAAAYLTESLESMFDTYNNISKMPYYYNNTIEGSELNTYMSFDHFRQIVYGTLYSEESMETRRKRDMEEFLRYIHSVDSSISGVHFVGMDQEGNQLDFHYSLRSTYFRDAPLFEELTGYQTLDRTSNKMIIVPPHGAQYYSGLSEPVFTVARNYFDLRGTVGNMPYVGTIFLDVDINRVEHLLESADLGGNESFFVVDQQSRCFYSSDKEKTGTVIDLADESLLETEKQLVIRTKPNDYGLFLVAVIDTQKAFGSIRSMQSMMYLLLGASMAALLLSSVFFSKQLTRPIHEMMRQMEQVEHGQFDLVLPVTAGDEIGVLSQRFNQMSQALKDYINQYYVAQIKQNEAELTALKSQIYPHFLYNTLEIIRMTALEEGDEKVSEMIEALSEQIRYLIGPMQDMVPLEREIEMVKKYIYLLNCRIHGKIQLAVNAPGASQLLVPKLILQPIVENAYVHGIKPRKGSGRILIETHLSREDLEISIMDNGNGMDEAALARLNGLLAGDEPGIKNEYNWQSIGLKNVHDRIRFLYGEAYGVHLTSTPGVGTMVRILMKAAREGDECR